jgi:hypothetical protein
MLRTNLTCQWTPGLRTKGHVRAEGGRRRDEERRHARGQVACAGRRVEEYNHSGFAVLNHLHGSTVAGDKVAWTV